MNKTGIVTGGASGLGFEFSKLLARDSHDLILIDRHERMLSEAKEQIVNRFSISVDTIVCDLSKPQIAYEIFSKIGRRNIDVLVNNAGFGIFGFFSETEWHLEEEMIMLHVLTNTHLTKLILKKMLQKGHGKIVNISSLAAFQPGPLMSVYYATKAYILSLSEALANEVRGTGVTVTAICPGRIKTNFQRTLALHSKVKQSASKFYTISTERIAASGYKAMQAGKTIVIPGFFNRVLAWLPRILPRAVSAMIVRKIQEKFRS